MPTRFEVSREDRTVEHPTGWVRIGKFGSLKKAEERVHVLERGHWAYANKNPDRLYHMIAVVE